MLIAAGTILEGKYRIDRLLGAGGMGSVWIGQHELLKRAVAVKVLDSSVRKDPTAVERFMREAQTAALLKSDHIVPVFDVGRFDDGTPFLVMELLEGETLSSRIKRSERLALPEAALLCDQLLDGLGAAHDAHVIHRDIKPDNCFITQKNGRDHLKLLDFGISKVTGDAREMRMTKTGVVMGTPYYMAPEQARGAKEVDHRCDLYAAGAILYECVTGKIPFDAQNVNELLFKIVLEPLVPPRAHVASLDASFEAVILRAMAREAPDRFQTAREFRDALAPFLPRSASGELTVSGRVVIRSSPPPPMGTPMSGARAVVSSATPHEPVSAVAMTAPVSSADASDAIARYAQGGETRHTPFLGMSATGPIHPSQSPARRRAVGIVAIAALAGVIAGGGIYVSVRGQSAARDGAVTATGVVRTQPDRALAKEVDREAPAPDPTIAPSKSTIATASVSHAPVVTVPTKLPSHVGATIKAPIPPAKPADTPTHVTSTKPPIAPPTSKPNDPSPGRPIDETPL